MTDSELIILITVITIFIAICLILSSGVFIVKEDKICVFEKLYKFYTFKEKGIYFFTPFITKKVATYSTKNQYLQIVLTNYYIYIIYKINDVEKYHYNGNYKEKIYDSLKKEEHIIDDYKLYISSFNENHGVELIDIKIASKENKNN